MYDEDRKFLEYYFQINDQKIKKLMRVIVIDLMQFRKCIENMHRKYES